MHLCERKPVETKIEIIPLRFALQVSAQTSIKKTKHVLKKQSKSMQNCVKMTLWSSREPFGALLGHTVYFKTSFGSGLYSFWEPLGIPFGSLFGTFSSLGRSWDLKMVAFGRGPFGHHFLDQILKPLGH